MFQIAILSVVILVTLAISVFQSLHIRIRGYSNPEATADDVFDAKRQIALFCFMTGLILVYGYEVAHAYASYNRDFTMKAGSLTSEKKCKEPSLYFSNNADRIAEILENIQNGNDQLVVTTGGSASAGGGGVGFRNIFSETFVQVLNEQYTNNYTGKFVHKNMAHGTTDSFWSANLMTSLIPHEASIVAWEFNINDVSGFTIDLWMKMVFNHCPKCVIAIAYIWDYPRYHPDRCDFPGDSLFNVQKDTIMKYSNYFVSSLATQISNTNASCKEKRKSLADAHHPTLEAHVILGNLMAKSFACSNGISSKPTSHEYTRIPQYESESKKGIVYNLLMKTTRSRSFLFDDPTLSNTSTFSTKSKSGSKSDPKRQDRQKFHQIDDCTQFKFEVIAGEKGLLGIGIWGQYDVKVHGVSSQQRIQDVDAFIKEYHKYWPVWILLTFKENNVNVEICGKGAKLRWMAIHNLDSESVKFTAI